MDKKHNEVWRKKFELAERMAIDKFLEEMKKIPSILPLLYPEAWKKEHPNA